MFLRQLDLTTALRPSLLPDETLLFVQDAVGLYEGSVPLAHLCLEQSLILHTELPHRKYKLPNYQNGHAYLTSHRACYVDNEEPRKYSVALELKDVEKSDFYVR